jgi:hypothetical protein
MPPRTETAPQQQSDATLLPAPAKFLRHVPVACKHVSDLQQYEKHTATLARMCSSADVACSQLLDTKLLLLLSSAVAHSLHLLPAAGGSIAAGIQLAHAAPLDVLCKLTSCIKECLQAAYDSPQQQQAIDKVASTLTCSGKDLSMHAWLP